MTGKIYVDRADAPASLSGWMLVDRNGLPRYWAHAWASMSCSNLAESTVAMRLDAIQMAYVAVERRLGSDVLDTLIAQGDVRRLQSAFEGLHAELKRKGADTGVGMAVRWRVAKNFVLDTLSRLHLTELDPKAANELGQRLDALQAQLGPLECDNEIKAPNVMSMPSVVLGEVHAIIDPASRLNPFKTEQIRFRNYVIVLVGVRLGLRRGEQCILAVDAVGHGIDERTGQPRWWLTVARSPNTGRDVRKKRPSIKTQWSRRQIPISADLAELINEYADSYRCNSGRRHAFLFTSQLGRPLSPGQVNDVWSCVSSKLSDTAKSEMARVCGKPNATPHSARHTAVVLRLARLVDSGMDLNTALEAIRPFFGWSLTSSMPSLYGAAYFESRMNTVWSDRFDEHVEALRGIEGSQWL